MAGCCFMTGFLEIELNIACCGPSICMPTNFGSPNLNTPDAVTWPKGCTMAPRSGGIRELNEALLAAGVAMNQAGGLLKVSPDGGLLQSSTLADEVRARRAAPGSRVSHPC